MELIKQLMSLKEANGNTKLKSMQGISSPPLDGEWVASNKKLKSMQGISSPKKRMLDDM